MAGKDANRVPYSAATQEIGLTRREREILTLLIDELSNAEIAERLVMSLETVRWYVKEIYSKLGVHSRGAAIVAAQALVDSKPAALTAPQGTPHNLPARATSFIGREREIAAVRDLLLSGDTRLLTLVGIGGMGKTRLSIESGYALLDAFPDGVWFIALAPLGDPAFVGETAAQTLGIFDGSSDPLAAMKNALHNKHAVLIFDNFEHVLDAAPLVSGILNAAPRVKVLATSREPLNLYGEQLYAVPPLTPESEAITLFAQRARAVNPAFTITAENRAIIEAICVRLDGMPLAIELAAARTRLFTPQALLDRLDNRLNLLTSGARDTADRHRTLRAAIDWSYQLLNDDEKRLFRRMGVFAGGWTLEAVDAVGGADLQSDVYDVLDSLVSKSLVKVTDGVHDEPRFLMLETLREYALEQLDAVGERDHAERLHADYFLQIARIARWVQPNPEGLAFYDRLDADMDNLRAALDAFHKRDDTVEQEFEMIGALEDYWNNRSYINDAKMRSEAALRRDGEHIPPGLRAGVYTALGYIQSYQFREAAARRTMETGLALAYRAEEPHLIASALIATLGLYDIAHDLKVLEESLDILPGTSQFTQMRLIALLNYAMVLAMTGEEAQAEALTAEASELAHHANDVHAITALCSVIGFRHNRTSNFEATLDIVEEGLAAAQQLGHTRYTINLLLQRAGAQMRLGRVDDLRITVEEMNQIAERRNNDGDRMTARRYTAEVALLDGNPAQARAILREVLMLGHSVDSEEFKFHTLNGAAMMLTRLGEHALAARAYGTVDTGLTKIGLARSYFCSPTVHIDLDKTREALGADEFERLFAEGEAMPVDQVWAMIIAEIDRQ